MPKIREVNDNDLPDDIDMPDEVYKANQKATSPELLTNLGTSIAKKRDEAVKARKESGIEEIWLECEESYLGIDATNRAEFSNAKWAKPTSMDAPVTANSSKPSGIRSTVFVRLTSRYVDAGTAKLAEILLPPDDKNFSLKADPKPDLVTQKDDHRAVLDNATGQLATKPAENAPVAAPNPAQAGAPAPQAPAVQPLTMADIAAQQIEDAETSASKAEDRIYTWMLDCGYPKEVRKVIHDAGRIGVGVLKAPTPAMSSSMALTKGDAGGKNRTLEIKSKLVPVAKWVDPWNIFPDPACGEEIHDGDYILERDFLSPKKLKDLKKLSGYISSQIDKVLDEGVGKTDASESKNPNEADTKARFEVWYYYGQLKREDLVSANAVGAKDLPADKKEVYSIVTIVNDTVIKADINPLDSGRFPYNAMPWSRRAGNWAGVGIAEQISMPQRMCNASTRAMLNNAGKSAGAQVVIDQSAVTPADGDWTITPDKIWYLNAESGNDDVRKAFMSIQFPDVQEALMRIVEFSFKLAEEACNIPLVTQGINDQKTPDTFGATQIQDSNAHTLLRSIGNIFDDTITSPSVHGFYEWLLLDPDVPDDEKLEFQINAHGSSALVERAIQAQTLEKMGEATLNPAFGVNPKKWFSEMMKSKRFDPSKFQYTEEELDEQKKNAAPPIPIQVAQIRANADQAAIKTQAQADMELAQHEYQQESQQLQNGQATPHQVTAQARIQEAHIRAQSAERIQDSRASAEMAYANTEAQMARDNAMSRLQEMKDKRELMILEYSLKNNLTLEQTKGDLARVAMMEQTKRELAHAGNQLAASEGAQDRTHDMTKHVSQLTADAKATQQAADAAKTNEQTDLAKQVTE